MIPIVYNIRSVTRRPVSTALTALGVGLVVAVFIGMLALANGFAAALAKTGSTGNAIVLRKGADSELSSGLGRDVSSIVAADPHVAKPWIVERSPPYRRPADLSTGARPSDSPGLDQGGPGRSPHHRAPRRTTG